MKDNRTPMQKMGLSRFGTTLVQAGLIIGGIYANTEGFCRTVVKGHIQMLYVYSEEDARKIRRVLHASKASSSHPLCREINAIIDGVIAECIEVVEG